MSYFAQIESNYVVQVRVVEPSFMAENPERYPGIWVECVTSGSDAKKIAAPGYIYDSKTGHFKPQQPFLSWTFNESDWKWEAPLPYPGDDNIYVWNEELQEWTAVENETE